MASLSPEEENYVRMSLLLTGISPRAARVLFDREFHPSCLDSSLKKAYNTLSDLKNKHVINAAQWNLLFTRFPDVPDSRTFDMTLMILLLRNLTPMTSPLCGFDRLPSAMEITSAVDLSRIKHYRNYLAHLVDGKLDTGFFNTAWNDIACAIERLGGQQMKQECDHLKTKPLDQTNQEIIMDIKHSNNEIRELKKSLKSLKRSHTEMMKSHEIIQQDYTEVKKSHEILQDDHKNVTDEIEKIKNSQKDTVPWNTREIINDTLKDWKDNDDTMFIDTRAAQYVLKCIHENSCVTITASSGVGKTATLRHVALQMAKEEFDVIPVTDPADIVRFRNPKKKTLFVVDDLCGNFSLDQSDIKSWEPIMEDMEKALDKKQTKIIAACRLQVYQDGKFDCLSVFKLCECNMLSRNICLSKTEKDSIAKLYLNEKASEIIDFSELYDCFPLLCKLYHNNPEIVITDFFQDPFSIYEAEIDNFLKKGHYIKYCALALCVMFNNKLKKEMFTEDVNAETRTIIENTCEACRLDRGTSRLVLQDHLDALTHTFIKKEQNMYKVIHDKIFDFLAKIYGQQIIYCLIRNADSGLIKERFLLERKDDMHQFTTIIPTKYHQIYIQRMIDDWSKGKVPDVFNNINMKIPQFRQTFLIYLNTLDISYQRQLANTCEEHGQCKTSLLNCCYLGDISLVKWCCNLGVDVNECINKNEGICSIQFSGQEKETVTFLVKEGVLSKWVEKAPLMAAFEHGNTEIVKILLDKGADCNKCDRSGKLPLMKACEHGHTDIVQMLLDKGADCNKCDSVMSVGRSPLMLACRHGHTEIVKMLLDIGVDFNKCDWYGQSPVMKACEHGHTDIVKILLDRGVDFNKCENFAHMSPIMQACENGHTKIVKMLLDKGVDFNKCDRYNQSPVMKACENGHTKIVKMLLDRGGGFYKCDLTGQLLLMAACKHGHTEIVKMMLDSGVDCNTCDREDRSPFMKACEHGHTDIVKMLLDRGVDCNKCSRHRPSPIINRVLMCQGEDFNKSDCWGESPVMEACKNGHTEIVKMLLDIGVDFNKCDWYGQSPVMKACEHGHAEIVNMLLDRGADCNKCEYFTNMSPFMKACENGHTEIVKMLLDIGVEFNKCDWKRQALVMKACKNGHTKIVKMLLDRGEGFYKCDLAGQSLLLTACKHGHKEIVKMMLDRGVDCNTCDTDGQSSVWKACKHGHTDIVKMLLDRGVDFNKCARHLPPPIINGVLICQGEDFDKSDCWGESPVIKACKNGHTEIVKMLLDIGVDFNKSDRYSQSPFMKACEHGHTDIVKMLLDRGVDFNKCDIIGQSPIMKASEHGHTEIVNMLIDRGVDFDKYETVIKGTRLLI